MELQSEDVLDHLTSLVDQSLVLLEGGEAGPVRCRLLESVRAYARARLADSGEAETYRQQHAVYYLGLAEEALPAPGRTLQPAVLDRLAQAHDNLRAALRWCIAQDDAGRGLRLADPLGRFWDARGHWSEGRAWLAALLALPHGPSPTAWRAMALWHAGYLAQRQADHAAAHVLYAQSLAMWRRLGDARGIARTLNSLAGLAHRRGDYDAAHAHLEAALAIWQASGDKWRSAEYLNLLGELAREAGDHAAAVPRYKQNLALRRALG